MKYLYEEVAYLKGLAEGLEISKEGKEGKIIHKIIDVLEAFADSIVELDEQQCDLAEYVESIDEDLSDIEDDIYDEEIDEDAPLRGVNVGFDYGEFKIYSPIVNRSSYYQL